MHAELIAEHGGRAGIRDEGLLSSALVRPRNRRVYGASTNLFKLAAGYGVGIIRNHPFIDGNKRTGHAALETLLVLNGYQINASVEEQVEVILKVASGTLDRSTFTEWLRTHVGKR